MIRIIVVEDDPMVAQLHAAYLSRMRGFQVTGIFSNGREALEFLKETPVELAVVDVNMPLCSGMELLRQMRGSGIHTAVIMVTAATEMRIVEEAMRLGIEDYIIKPFSYQRLGEAVKTYLNKANLVRHREKADQAVVDQLLRNAFASQGTTRELRKGLNAKTLDSIEALIRENPDSPHTCESISAESGLSKVTVRHYLNYLMETGVLRSSIDYETGGRPRVLYRLK